MAQTRAWRFAEQADAADNQPILLARLFLSALTKYLSSRGVTVSGQAYEELLKDGVTLSVFMDAFGRVSRSGGSLVIANEDDGSGLRFSDLFAAQQFQNYPVEIDLSFLDSQGPLPATDQLRIFTGLLDVPIENCFDDRAVRLNLLDDGNPARGSRGQQATKRIHKLLGDVVDRATFPIAHPDAVGKMVPIVYGKVRGHWALPVEAGQVDTLAKDFRANDSSIILSDERLYPLFPSSGMVKVEEEIVSYSTKSFVGIFFDQGFILGGLTRAAPIDHLQGRSVYVIRPYWDFLVAAHPCQEVKKVLVDGTEFQSNFGQAWQIVEDGRGWTYIRFANYPKIRKNVAIRSEGSHDHPQSTGVTERPLTPALPFSVNIDGGYISWPSAPPAGTLVQYRLKLGALVWSNGVPYVFTCGNAIVDLTTNDVFVQAFALGNENSANIAAGGQPGVCQVLDVERTYITDKVTAPSPAKDIANYDADIVLGKVVTCEVEGQYDDGSGTYTGTPFQTIQNPAHIVSHVAGSHLGLPLATWIDAANFAEAAAAFDAAGIFCDCSILERVESAELLEALRSAVAARLYLTAEGKFKIFLLPPAGPLVRSLTEADDLLEPAASGRTPLSELYNHVSIKYDWDPRAGSYQGLAEAQDVPSQDLYRTTNKLELTNDFIRNAAAAQAVADRMLAWHKDQRWLVRALVPALPNLHLELLDRISLTIPRMPGGWSAKEFYVVGIEKAVSRPGATALDQMTLSLREA